MSVETHLGIALDEFDERIRTFVPYYEDLLDAAASVINPGTRTILDLGIGTGALSARCMAVARRARIVGIDSDPAMRAMAVRRLGGRAVVLSGDFQSMNLPKSEAVVASLALHHVRTRAAKARVYRRIGRALGQGGTLVNADCCPAEDAREATRHHQAWRDHLRKTYTSAETTRYLRAWGHEDVYMPLNVEIDLMRGVGFRTEVIWRRDAFAVVVGWKR